MIQFAQCRAGGVDVLMGSTPKLGVGTNVQTRLVALHHVDAPWLPSEIEQREGRIIRPRNSYQHVHVIRYVTEGTFDAMVWETLQRKARFIASFMSANADAREVEDVTGVVLSFGQVKALAAGRPELLRQAELSSAVQRLRIARAVWGQQVASSAAEAQRLRRSAEALLRKAECLAEFAETPARAGGSSGVGALVVENLSRERDRPTWLTQSSPYRRLAWRGADLRVDVHGGNAAVELLIGYRPIATFEVPRKTVRRGAEVVEKTVHEWAAGWLDEAAQRAQDFADEAREANRRAQELEVFVESAVFDQEAELSGAEVELQSIESVLAGLAEAPVEELPAEEAAA